ncbi:MAG: tetratricopeptide repeat protein [Chloroflexi bacterium]|nr:tetratricopeptide repeat protein [Chloroflexota bacterium]
MQAASQKGMRVLPFVLWAILLGTLSGDYSRVPLYSLVFQLIATGVGIYWFLRYRHRVLELWRGRLKWVLVAWALFLLWAFLTALSSVNVADSLFQFGLWASYFLIFVMSASILASEEDTKKTISLLFLLGLVVVGVGIWMRLGAFEDGTQIDLKSIFRNRNVLAAYLSLSLPLTVGLYLNADSFREKMAYCAVGTLLATGFVLTHSSAGWVTMAPALLLLFILLRHLSAKRLVLRLLVLVALTTALVVPLERGGFKYAANTFYGNIVEATEAVSGKPVTGTVSSRIDYYRAALDIMADEPITGTGLGTWETVFPRYQGQPVYYSIYAHGFFLQTGSEMGAVGLFLVLALFGALGWVCWRSLRVTRRLESYVVVAGLTAGFLAVTLHNFLDIAWYFPSVSILFWAEAGLVVAQLRREEVPRSERVANPLLGPSEEITLSKTRDLQGISARLALVFLPVLFVALFLFVALELGEHALLRIGDAFMSRSRFQAAEGAYLWASRFNPLDSQPPFRLANLYNIRFEKSSSQEDLERGVLFAKRVEELDPRSSSGYAILARFYIMGDSRVGPMLDKAIAELEKLIEMRRPFQAPYGYRELGRAYLSQGRTEDAKRVYAMILQAYPEGIYSRQPSHTPLSREELAALLGESHLAIGKIYFEEGDSEPALREFEQAANLQPDNPAARFNLGLSYYERGDVEKALLHLKEAVALDPGYAPAHYYAGLSYQSLGRMEEARISFENAIAIAPEYSEARESLELLVR